MSSRGGSCRFMVSLQFYTVCMYLCVVFCVYFYLCFMCVRGHFVDVGYRFVGIEYVWVL